MTDQARYDWDVFISYSHADGEWVQTELLPRLRQARVGEKPLRVCIDSESFEVGAPIVTEIERAVQNSRKTVLVLTPNYLNSDWATFENVMLAALDPASQQRRLTPLLVKKCELPLRIRSLVCVDLASATDVGRQFGKLLRAIGASEESLPEERYEQAPQPTRPAKSPSLRISPKHGREMILIPAGEFIMGSDSGEGNEKPQRKVYLPDFYISRYPITNAEFEAFVKATGHVTIAEKEGKGRAWLGDKWDWVKGADWRHPRGPDSSIAGKNRHPVVQVSWNDAVAYCQWTGKRLPTEAEWEKAARGTEGRTWPWGDEWVDGKCNTSEAGVGDTTPVGRYSPASDSLYGVADMAGNVWDWTADWYKAYPGSTFKSDDYGEKYRVVRGGSWLNLRGFARCAFRGWSVPGGWDFNVGFRVVVSLADADF